VKSKKKAKLTIQCDEMWSFVCSQDNKQWILLGIDTSTKEIVGVYIGKKERGGRRDYGIPCHQFIVNVP